MSKKHSEEIQNEERTEELADEQLEGVAGGYLGLAAGAVVVAGAVAADQLLNDGKGTKAVKQAVSDAKEGYDNLVDALDTSS